VFSLALSLVYPCAAQSVGKTVTDSTRTVSKSSFLAKQAVPGLLVVSGLSLTGRSVKQDIQDWFPRTSTKADNWLQWSPGALMYVSDIFVNKHRDDLFGQTKYLTISLLATSAVTQLLKVTAHVRRPNGGSLSFPSGHTSNAFAGATVFFHEFKDTSPLFASSGYLLSSATGILRITNNRHWLPDVLVGAGIGILVTNIVYAIEPLRNWDPFRKAGGEKLTMVPDFYPREHYLCLTVKINLDHNK